MATTINCHLLRLPREIRNLIYHDLVDTTTLKQEKPYICIPDWGTQISISLRHLRGTGLLRACKQLHAEMSEEETSILAATFDVGKLWCESDMLYDYEGTVSGSELLQEVKRLEVHIDGNLGWGQLPNPPPNHDLWRHEDEALGWQAHHLEDFEIALRQNIKRYLKLAPAATELKLHLHIGDDVLYLNFVDLFDTPSHVGMPVWLYCRNILTKLNNFHDAATGVTIQLDLIFTIAKDAPCESSATIQTSGDGIRQLDAALEWSLSPVVAPDGSGKAGFELCFLRELGPVRLPQSRRRGVW